LVPMLCPAVLTSSSDHSAMLEAIQHHRLANKHTTSGLKIIFLLLLFAVSLSKTFPRLEYKMRCLSLSLNCESIRFFFYLVAVKMFR
jgi:hypothetical protein